MKSFFQGDIVLVHFPFTDGKRSKPRPAIVISNSIVNKTNDVILAQITSTLRNDDFSFELEEAQLSHSLRKPSEVRCHKVFVMEKKLIIKKISRLESNGFDGLRKKVFKMFL